MDKTFLNLFARRGLSLDRLRVLLEIADAGGIAKAVGKDPVRQSQYSRQLKELEEYFGVELTRRDGKSLVLTRAGQQLADIIRQNFLGLADFATACAHEPAIFHLGAGDSLIHWKVLPHIGAFQKVFPAIIMSIRNLQTAQIIDALHSLRLDFGIMRRNAIPSVFKSVSLGKMEYALFVPKQLLPGSSGKTCEWVMNNVPMVAMDSSGEFARKLDEMMRRSRIKMNIRLECESFPAACHAIQSGCYAGILPTMAATDLPEDKFVRIEAPLFKRLSREIALAWNPRIMRLRSASVEIASWFGKNL
ncbi:MAG: LysR family transcriptional regulator [Verrucomicrobia bacterium]|nr:LysR family transcriptional regulator [Verrucomicrobiota bacterium]MCG2679923.1 LysR family transcriptional regulator [Kiritimatiellia bacterium]MBU4247267.1 LysR family transcriptional regulator [Verrucomicrobiota bacterium]MBU4290548.1 LysR family transcriptional regulator [Verrucomicrobiota bacterium]MBU4428508.1 LysR family transcriptional regulator [Verrucomicrobiota bacterium]